MRHLARAALLVVGLVVATASEAYDGLVEKNVFTIPTFKTVGGRTIRDVRIGYATCGTSNAAGTDAILVAHSFSGSSHAAGRDQAGDAAPGYRDAVIGAGTLFHTDRYFVVSSDSLVDVSTKDPNVRADQLFRVGQAATLAEGASRIEANVLAIPASDRLSFPEYTTTMPDRLKKQGVSTESFVIPGDGGHPDGVADIAKVGDALRAFLAR